MCWKKLCRCLSIFLDSLNLCCQHCLGVSYTQGTWHWNSYKVQWRGTNRWLGLHLCQHLVLTLWQGLILCTARLLCYVWELCTALCLMVEIDTSTKTVYPVIYVSVLEEALDAYLSSLIHWTCAISNTQGTGHWNSYEVDNALIDGLVFICAKHFSIHLA